MFGQVMFPTLAHIQQDLPRFRRLYVSATRQIALLSFPLMTGLAALSAPFILFIFGDKWSEVIPILRVLSLVGLFQSIVYPVRWIFTALGKTKAQFQLSIFTAIGFVVAIYLGIQYGGILGVACAYAAFAVAAGLLNLHLAGKYIELSARSILVGVARIFLMACIMGLGVFIFDVGLAAAWPAGARLFVGVLVGICSYVALCLLMKDVTFQEMIQLVASRIGIHVVFDPLK
jgi:O-antigen/teichoic acid export membrane protein